MRLNELSRRACTQGLVSAVIGAAGCASADPAATTTRRSTTAGVWSGGYLQAPRDYAAIDLTLNEPGQGGAISSFRLGLRNVALSPQGASENLSFTFADEGARGSFTGRVRGDTLAGVMSIDGADHVVEFSRSAPQRDYATLLGAYRTEAGDVIAVGRIPASQKIALTNFSDGSLRTLFPTANGFFVGRSYGVPSPVARRVTIDGEALTLRSDTGPEIVARRMPIRTEEIALRSYDGTEFFGSLLLPPGDGPFPAVVFAHGSLPDRHSFLSLQYLLPTLGIAAIAWDKRGSAAMQLGRSGGEALRTFDEVMYSQLGRDIVAVVGAAKSRAEIDANRVGVIGISQAGWTVPIAATLDPSIATTLLVSGPSVSTGQEQEYSVLTQDGASNGSPQSELDARMATSRPSGFDPQPLIRQMTMPGMWLFGAKDQSVPAQLCFAEMRKLRAEGLTHLETKLYDTGQHVLWETERGTMGETPLVQRYVPGFHADVRSWLAAHL